ncbi:hypothetical protein Poli38472_002446 [Pythium oligandrum]|uniref:Uncharacterized protein n=1 Tax=Pythium oligandrum TaxID=41045 RepID=A0A8K1CHV3_PYTOL|nr:hypothetical protein Poli38472_002446 [Pythium oligandrum]|eukprot:TMW63505.1 hypothetical protein Poli38472_002446 [Pythium oligandrum]
MAIVLNWMRVFKFNWLRKCKACGGRRDRCLCKRPSLAMEQIFFLEERKNKFGARNFSHVSDTVISSSTSGTVLSSGTSFGEEYRAGDFYRSTQQRSSPRQNNALVRKNSGKMVLVHRGSNPRPVDDMAYDYNTGNVDQNDPYSSKSVERTYPRPRRQLPPSRSSSGRDSAPRRDDRSIQVYSHRNGRGGRSSSRSSSRMGNNDSLIIRPSNSSSYRPSAATDRLSVDCNIGSFNPASKMYGSSYAPSIAEDETDVLNQLNGLLQLPSPASSTSTALDHARYRPFY